MTTTEQEAATDVVYDLEGTLLEACSCGVLCPCWVGSDPDGGTCDSFNAYHFDRGTIHGVDVGGLSFINVCHIPGNVLVPGSWQVVSFVDDRANQMQYEAILDAYHGRLGGPLADLAGLVGEVVGVERAAIEMRDDGLLHSVRVGDAIDFEVEDIVPFGSEDGRPVRVDGTFHPAGPNLTIAGARRSRIDAFGIRYEGKTGLSTAEFAWSA